MSEISQIRSCWYTAPMMNQTNHNPPVINKAQLLHESAVVERQRQIAERLGAQSQAQAQSNQQNNTNKVTAAVAPTSVENDQQRLLRLALQAKQHSQQQQNHPNLPTKPSNPNSQIANSSGTAAAAGATGKKKKKRKKKKKQQVSTTTNFAGSVVDLGKNAPASSTSANVSSVSNRIPATSGASLVHRNLAHRMALGVGLVNHSLDSPEGQSVVVDLVSPQVHARESAGTVSSGNTAVPPNGTDTGTSSVLKRPVVKRKASTDNGSGTTTTVQSVLKRARIRKKIDTANEPLSMVLKQSLKVDDFWRAIRNWDFAQDIVNEIGTAKTKGRGKAMAAKKSTHYSSKSSEMEEGEEADEEGELSEAVPDTFSSYQEYISVWEPLLLNEMKAQLISEVRSKKNLSKVDWCSLPQGCTLRVVCAPLLRDVGSASDSITIQLRSKKALTSGIQNEQGGKEFITNDFVLLAVPTDMVGKIKSRIGDSPKQRSLVGHVEYSRKTVDGLIVKVSRELWTKLGSEEMYILNLGSNVTALREYTALSRIEQVPILDDLLGGNARWSKAYARRTLKSVLRKVKGDRKGKVTFSQKLIVGPFTGESPKNQHISKLGGVEALGKGWVEYATKKFNSSQLEAVSAAANQYGSGGFTLIKGPPGTGKTTTLVALLNALHIKQYHKYHDKVRTIISRMRTGMSSNQNNSALKEATKCKPRILVCAPSNAAVDNIILKIMESGFIDGSGMRYNPSMIRVGSGQSDAVKDVALERKINSLFMESTDIQKMQANIDKFRSDLNRCKVEIHRCQKRLIAMENAAPYALAKHYEIRCDETSFDQTGRIYFVNHKEKSTSFDIPPAPKSEEKSYTPSQMPEFRKHTNTILKMIEKFNSVSAKLSMRELIMKTQDKNSFDLRSQLETGFLDSCHIVLTTLGSAGSKALEYCNKFECVVVDEAAQSVEPSTLSALELGSSHAVLVGDPQQLPATIFSLSGRKTKFDRSLFQRLEEAGHPVHMLDTQYRMNPMISFFPRSIFYNGELNDGPNVRKFNYGDPLRKKILSALRKFQALTILNLNSSEQRSGTSLSNMAEARLALDLFLTLNRVTGNELGKFRVAVITPYSQQLSALRNMFKNTEGTSKVELNTVDAFQGREADIVIFSCVRAGGSSGIGFLSDVRRMNVALTRAKHFLFVIGRCDSITSNPYWRELIVHAREKSAIVNVPVNRQPGLIF